MNVSTRRRDVDSVGGDVQHGTLTATTQALVRLASRLATGAGSAALRQLVNLQDDVPVGAPSDGVRTLEYEWR